MSTYSTQSSKRIRSSRDVHGDETNIWHLYESGGDVAINGGRRTRPKMRDESLAPEQSVRFIETAGSKAASKQFKSTSLHRIAAKPGSKALKSSDFACPPARHPTRATPARASPRQGCGVDHQSSPCFEITTTHTTQSLLQATCLPHLRRRRGEQRRRTKKKHFLGAGRS